MWQLRICLFLLLSTEVLSQTCCPCGSTDDDCFRPLLLGRLDLKIDGPAESTCASLTVELTQFDDKPGDCRDAISTKNFERCCGDAEPDPNDYTWTGEKDNGGQKDDMSLAKSQCGPNLDQCDQEVCHICWQTQSYPDSSHHIIAALYIPGSNNCGEVYQLGLAGGIKNSLCRPLQDYIYDEGVCDCPTTDGGGGSGNGGDGSAQEEEEANADIKVDLLDLIKKGDGRRNALKELFLDGAVRANRGNRRRRRLRGD